MKGKAILLTMLFGVLMQAQNLKVMSFNVRLSVDSDKENSWNNRKTDVLKLIEYYHPDVMGVQEPVPQQMKDLKAGLPQYNFVGVGREDGKDKGEYSAIFYNIEKLKVVKSGTFWLSETPEVPSKGWDAALPRICSYAQFKDLKSGKQFWAFNVHFDHIGMVARVNSSKLILEKIKEFNTKNLPVILTGDFNLPENTEPIQILSKNLDDTLYKTIAPHYGPTYTWQDFDTNKIPEDRIDYIFVKGFKILTNRTINDRRDNLLYYSDHFPILSDIQFLK